MFELLSDPRIYEFIEDEPPSQAAALESKYRKAATRVSPDGTEGWFEWVVRRDGMPMGYAQTTVFLLRNEAALAYVLAPRFWGNGYASECCRLMIQHLAVLPGLERFIIETDVDNLASQRLAERSVRCPNVRFAH
jgi:RimJ/RimL family protein N-acetyltransferase